MEKGVNPVYNVWKKCAFYFGDIGLKCRKITPKKLYLCWLIMTEIHIFLIVIALGNFCF